MNKNYCVQCGTKIVRTRRSDCIFCCDACQENNWYYRNREKSIAGQKKSRLNWRYGLTISDFEKIKDRQDNSCAICKCTDKRLNVDHDHISGETRALLCHACNTALAYLEKHISEMWRYLGGNYRIYRYGASRIDWE